MMQYIQFSIENYRAIRERLTIDISKNKLVPLIGINECGKTTILQAIFCFDYQNDRYNESRHLKDVHNLYDIAGGAREAKISAVLEVGAEEMKESYEYYISTKTLLETSRDDRANEDERDAAVEEAKRKEAEMTFQFMERWGDSKRALAITRTIGHRSENPHSHPYTAYTALTVLEDGALNEMLRKEWGDDSAQINKFVRALLRYGPHILYSDDFNDRPPSAIPIPKSKDDNNLGEWQEIYDTLFRKALPGFGLRDVVYSNDSRLQDSQLREIGSTLLHELRNAWSTFLPQRGRKQEEPFSFRFIVEDSGEERKLRIFVVEELRDKGSAARSFDITDRSKGFVWYFNLIMKIYFNPKAHRNRSNGNTVFLLDEPGSYLHHHAQSALCKQLAEYSRRHGTIIYCTHSDELLNPEYIPVQSVRIVERGDPNNNISLQSPGIHKAGIVASEQPLLEALRIPYFRPLDIQCGSVLVEGVFDAYVLRLFVLPNMSMSALPHVVPASGANSIVKLLSYFIGFGFKYVALWDNDKEGRAQYKRALKEFDELEEDKFLLLLGAEQARNTKQIRFTMEKMFTGDDMAGIAEALQLEGAQTYGKTILAVYAATDEQKERIRNEVLERGTRERFRNLAETLESKLTDTS